MSDLIENWSFVLLIIAGVAIIYTLSRSNTEKAVILLCSLIAKFLYDLGYKKGRDKVDKDDAKFKSSFIDKENEANRTSDTDIDDYNRKWLHKNDKQ